MDECLFLHYLIVEWWNDGMVEYWNDGIVE